MPRPAAGMTAASLSEAMVGATTRCHSRAAVRRHKLKPDMLRVDGLSAPASAHGVALRDINFDVQGGEIFGLAGIGGNGQAELVEALIGIRPRLRRHRFCSMARTMPPTPEARREAGLRYIPADRMGMGLFGELPLNVNIALPRLLGRQAEHKWLVRQRLDEPAGRARPLAITRWQGRHPNCRCACSPAAMRRS